MAGLDSTAGERRVKAKHTRGEKMSEAVFGQLAQHILLSKDTLGVRSLEAALEKALDAALLAVTGVRASYLCQFPRFPVKSRMKRFTDPKISPAARSKAGCFCFLGRGARGLRGGGRGCT